MSTPIEIHGLVKKFGSVRALDGLDLARRGRARCTASSDPTAPASPPPSACCSGLLRASAGTVRLLGGDPWADAAALHRRLAYVPGDVTLWPNLTGGEVIDLLGRLRGGLDESRRADLVERFELDPTKKGRTYSKGNRQKVALVAALASDVELLLLDEPTSGLDPLMESVFQQCVEEFRAQGGTVLLSSHILAEVERLCDRVSIIRAGRMRRDGHAHRAAPPHPHDGARRDRRARSTGSAALAGVHDLLVEGHRVAFEVDTAELRRRARPRSTGPASAP